MDLIGDGKSCEEVCKHAPPEKDKWPCKDCDIRWHDRAEPPRVDPCADCVYYPPSSTDGKPCCACDPANPLTNCHP